MLSLTLRYQLELVTVLLLLNIEVYRLSPKLTVVATIGEHQNAMPVYYNGNPTNDKILKDYLKEIEEE